MQRLSKNRKVNKLCFQRFSKMFKELNVPLSINSFRIFIIKLSETLETNT